MLITFIPDQSVLRTLQSDVSFRCVRAFSSSLSGLLVWRQGTASLVGGVLLMDLHEPFKKKKNLVKFEDFD